MQEMQFDDLRVAKAVQILLADYGLYSEVDDYNRVLIFEDGVFFTDEDWAYADFIVSYIGDELLMSYDVMDYRNMLIESINVMTLDEYMFDMSLCLCDSDDNVGKCFSELPTEDGYYDVYVHYNTECFSSAAKDGTVYTTEDVVNMIKADPCWDGVTKIRLMACWAGTTDVYIEIARKLKTHVKAPLGKLMVVGQWARYWVIRNEWFTIDSNLNAEEQMKQEKYQFLRMYFENDTRLSEAIQQTLWVEY